MKTVFDLNAAEYDAWFEKKYFAYQSEVEAIRRFIPKHGLGIEIGTGAGRFSVPFNISIGVEPSKAMAEIAESRGITVHNAIAEDLPFCKEHFDFVLIVTTLCFVDDPIKSIEEAKRILTTGGQLIIGILDRKSELGMNYEKNKSSDKFYNRANFFSTDEVISLLKEKEFKELKTCQTIFSHPHELKKLEEVKDGYGEGLFVAINSYK